MTAAAEPRPQARTGWLSALPNRMSDKWALAGLLCVALLQFTQIFRRSINWDEFWHYRQLHQLHDGTLTRPLQTLHTRLYGWVTELPGTSVDHIIVIRVFMYAYELIAAAALASLVARFANRTAGLLCALAYLSFPYVFQHGYSFRFDPPAIALMMVTLWLLSRRSLGTWQVALCGVLIGTAAMVTIKIVLLMPAFAGVLWLRWNEEQRSLRFVGTIAAIGAVALAWFATIFMLHSQGLAGNAADNAESIVSTSGGLMFKWEAKPYWPFVLRAAVIAPLVAIMVVLFPTRLRQSGLSRDEKIALVGLFLPITTLIFYHNTAPYFYVFMLPPVLVACCVSLPWLTDRFAVAGTSLLLVAIALVTLAVEEDSPIDKQRTLLRVAERTFPPGTAYFDFMGFLADQPKANGFMTMATIKSYFAAGQPAYSQALAERPVPLLVDNAPMYQQLLYTDRDVPVFMPEDAAALRDTYVHFWGPFWLAGEAIPASAEDHRFIIRVPGTYTVEGADVTIDGHAYRPGDTLALQRGAHTASDAREPGARIVWGDHLQAPSEAPPELPHFTGF